MTDVWSEKYRIDGFTRAALDRAEAMPSFQETRRVLRSGMRVLEAGSGTGRSSVALAAREPVDVVGADNSEGSLETSRLLLEQVDDLKGTCEFVEADLYRLPFPDQSFDVAFSDHVWEHLEHPLDALREIVRVLRPGGWFIFTTPNRWRPDGWDLYRALAHPPYHQDSYSPLALRALARKAGLEPVRIFGDEVWLERNVALVRAAVSARLRRSVGSSGTTVGSTSSKAGPSPSPARPSGAAKLRPRLNRLAHILLPSWLKVNVGVIAKRP